MPSDLVFLLKAIPAAVITVIICAILWAIFKHRRRARDLAASATMIGFSYAADGHALLGEGISEIPIFTFASLHRGKILNLMRGQSGSSAVAICDYIYWTQAGQKHNHAQTVFCFDVKRTRLPDFVLQPRGSSAEQKMLSLGLRLVKTHAKIFNLLQGGRRTELLKAAIAAAEERGIEFADHPDFSVKYHLHGSDPEVVKRLFKGGVVEVLNRQQEPFFTVAKAGNWLVVYRKDVLVKPEELWVALNDAYATRALFQP